MNNYSEGGTSSDNGWESILNAFVNNNNNDNTSNANNNNRGGGSLTPTTAVPTNTSNNNNINDGYAAYLQATYQLNNTTNQQQQQDNGGNMTDLGGSNYSPLNYNANPVTQGYSLNMPSTQYNNSQYNNNNTQQQQQQQHANNSSLSPAPINNGYGTSNNSGSSGNRGNRERSNSNNSLQLLDPYSTLIDYQPTPINQMQQQPNPVNGNMGAGQQGGNGLDYCDTLLQGMDDSSFNWLAGAFGGATNNNNNTASLGGNNNGAFYTATNNQFGGGGFVGEQMALPTGVGIQHNLPTGGIRHNIPTYPMQQQQPGMVGMGNNQNNELAAYFMAQQQQQQGMMGMTQQAAQFQQQQQVAAQQGKKKGRRSKSATTSRSRSTTTGRGRGRGRKSKSLLTSPEVIGSLGISSLHLPTGRDHSSLPSHQIDPLLDTITLIVSAVSLTPLNGNEVVRHIRTKTDDVITRFLPCVDFLVNCQQELRQGLQIAQRSQTAARRAHVTTGRRGGNGMTSRQFHSTYVAPLPKRFEKLNETLMAREYLIDAKIAMEVLVHDANTAIPQGCEQVKNAFLGGMRENESWGLRKWLSKHGGANSICNDLEEVHRNVKALKKDEQTTIRLAGMLRPIAKQAHDRLKKDVPQAYQEQSSAHPYLPFFHRLEACLKQMATYDPEKEDDVICLDLDSSDDDEAVKVVSKSPLVASSMSSSPVKKEGGRTNSKNLDSMKRSQKRSSNEDIANMTNLIWGNDLKRSKTSGMANDVINANKVAAEEDKKPKSTPKKEVEIICLDDSSDEEEAPPPPPAANKRSTVKDESNNAAFESSHGLEVLGAATFSPEPQETSRPPPQCNLTATTAVSKGGAGGSSQWRCTQCTYLNDAFATKCSMCEDSE